MNTDDQRAHRNTVVSSVGGRSSRRGGHDSDDDEDDRPRQHHQLTTNHHEDYIEEVSEEGSSDDDDNDEFSESSSSTNQSVASSSGSSGTSNVAVDSNRTVQTNSSRSRSNKGSSGGRKRTQLNKSCSECRRSHRACSRTRPCDRCVRLGIPERCQSTERKKRSVSKKQWINYGVKQGGRVIVQHQHQQPSPPISPLLNTVQQQPLEHRQQTENKPIQVITQQPQQLPASGHQQHQQHQQQQSHIDINPSLPLLEQRQHTIVHSQVAVTTPLLQSQQQRSNVHAQTGLGQTQSHSDLSTQYSQYSTSLSSFVPSSSSSPPSILEGGNVLPSSFPTRQSRSFLQQLMDYSTSANINNYSHNSIAYSNSTATNAPLLPPQSTWQAQQSPVPLLQQQLHQPQQQPPVVHTNTTITQHITPMGMIHGPTAISTITPSSSAPMIHGSQLSSSTTSMTALMASVGSSGGNTNIQPQAPSHDQVLQQQQLQHLHSATPLTFNPQSTVIDGRAMVMMMNQPWIRSDTLNNSTTTTNGRNMIPIQSASVNVNTSPTSTNPSDALRQPSPNNLPPQ